MNINEAIRIILAHVTCASCPCNDDYCNVCGLKEAIEIAKEEYDGQ